MLGENVLGVFGLLSVASAALTDSLCKLPSLLSLSILVQMPCHFSSCLPARQFARFEPDVEILVNLTYKMRIPYVAQAIYNE